MKAKVEKKVEEEKEEEKKVEEKEEKMDKFGRELFKAKCADCSQDCEVPFKPSGDRPVYCRDCFQKHRKPRRNF